MKGLGMPSPVKVEAVEVVLLATKPAGSLWGVSSKTVNLSMALGQTPVAYGAVHELYCSALWTSLPMRIEDFDESGEKRSFERK